LFEKLSDSKLHKKCMKTLDKEYLGENDSKMAD